MSRRGDNIRKRADGRWEGRYIIFRNSVGKAVYRSIYGKTYTEVKEKLNLCVKENNAQTGDSNDSVNDIAIKWLDDVKKYQKHSTYIKYEYIYNNHINQHIGKKKIKDITPDDCAKLLMYEYSNGTNQCVALSESTMNSKINDINWKTHTLKIITGKTGEPLELPLLDSVGWAIIDYLKNGRPVSGYTNVFLAHHFPYGPIGSTSSLTGALRKYLIKAEIKIKAGEAHGIHTLRSTLAKNMLFCGTELPVISQTLAHRDERTTVGNYLRIDTEHLRDCSLELEWEGESDAEL